MSEQPKKIVIKPVGANGESKPTGLIEDGSIKGSSFRLAKSRVKRRLIVSVEALEKSGKTHFAMTAPGPIGYMDFDIGGEGVVDKFMADKEVHQADYRLSFPYSQASAERVWKQFANDYKAALGSEIKSLIIDTSSEAWETLRIFRFGKLTQVMPHQYGPVNSEYREMIRLAYDSDCNLVLLHKLKKQYQNDVWTGRYERSGFGDTEFMVQVVLEAYKKDGEFWVRIKACRQNTSIEGQEHKDLTFAKLGTLVYPDTVEDDWK